MSPETQGILPPEYEAKPVNTYLADMWAVGVIGFLLLTKQSPFQNFGQLYPYVQGSKPFPSHVLSARRVSEDGQKFIVGFFCPVPETRWTAIRALNDKWIVYRNNGKPLEQPHFLLRYVDTLRLDLWMLNTASSSAENATLDLLDEDVEATADEEFARWTTVAGSSQHACYEKADPHKIDTAGLNIIKTVCDPKADSERRDEYNGNMTNVQEHHKNPEAEVEVQPVEPFRPVEYKKPKYFTGRLRRSGGQKTATAALAFSPDGAEITTVTHIGINVYSMISGTWKRSIHLPYTIITHSFRYLFNEKSATVVKFEWGTETGGMKYWPLLLGLARDTASEYIVGNANPLGFIDFSAGAAWIVSSSGYIGTTVTDALNWTKISDIDHEGTVCSLACSPAGSTIAISLSNGLIFTYSVERRKRLWSVPAVSPAPALKFSPDGAIIASKHTDGIIRLWKTEDGALIYEQEHRRDYMGPFGVSPHGDLFACLLSKSRKHIGLWRIKNGQWIRSFTHKRQKAITDFKFSPDGRVLASITELGETMIWDISEYLENDGD